ncbi:polyprotein [Fusarium langsethiae hypovirus 1]|uniref:Polyprotein n=1 Tax=Fusarium langsethiae hypovirus 1 TaxID=1926644 RepID=A0A1L5BUY9_9VIRU|nr:polyprotein [Fusarium langsethiae hypovirus 1]APL96674.1 polyprotein [Fusarium langsethiae hypovirus 1]
MSTQLESGPLQAARSLFTRVNAYESVDSARSARNTTCPLTPLDEANNNNSELFSTGLNTSCSPNNSRRQIVTGIIERPSHLSPWFMRKGARVPFRQAFVQSHKGKTESGAFWGSLVAGVGPPPVRTEKPAGYKVSARLAAKRERIAASRSRRARAEVHVDVDALHALFSDRLIVPGVVRKVRGRKPVRHIAHRTRQPKSKLQEGLLSGECLVEELWNDDVFHSVPARNFKRARDSSVADIEPNPGPPPAYKGKAYGAHGRSEEFLRNWANKEKGKDPITLVKNIQFAEFELDRYWQECGKLADQLASTKAELFTTARERDNLKGKYEGEWAEASVVRDPKTGEPLDVTKVIAEVCGNHGVTWTGYNQTLRWQLEELGKRVASAERDLESKEKLRQQALSDKVLAEKKSAVAERLVAQLKEDNAKLEEQKSKPFDPSTESARDSPSLAGVLDDDTRQAEWSSWLDLVKTLRNRSEECESSLLASRSELADKVSQLETCISRCDQLEVDLENADAILGDRNELRKMCGHHKYADEFSELEEVRLDEFWNLTQNYEDYMRLVNKLIQPVVYGPPYIYDVLFIIDANLEASFTRFRSPVDIRIGDRTHSCREPHGECHDVSYEDRSDRSEALYHDNEIIQLRHFKQDPDLRSVDNPGLHGLKLDLTTSPRKLNKTAWEFLQAVDYSCVPTGNVLVSASQDWQHPGPLPAYFIDLRVSNDFNRIEYSRAGKGSMTIHLAGIDGKALQLLRFAPLFGLSDGHQPIVLNGGKGGMHNYFDYDPNFPTPQVLMHYMHPSYAGACRLSRSDMEKHRDSWFKAFSGWSGVYGVDENLLLMYETFAFVRGSGDLKLSAIHRGANMSCHTHFIHLDTKREYFTLHWFSLAIAKKLASTTFSTEATYTHSRVRFFGDHALGAEFSPTKLFGSLPQRKNPYDLIPTLVILDDGGKTLLVNAYEQFVTATHSKQVVYDGHGSLSKEALEYLKTRDVVLVVADHWLDKLDSTQLCIKMQKPIKSSKHLVYHESYNRKVRPSLNPVDFFSDCISFANSWLENPIQRDVGREVSEANPGGAEVGGYDSFPLGYSQDSRFRTTLVNGDRLRKARETPKDVLEAAARVWASPDTIYAELPQFFDDDENDDFITEAGHLTYLSRIHLVILLLRRKFVSIALILVALPVASAAPSIRNVIRMVARTTALTSRTSTGGSDQRFSSDDWHREGSNFYQQNIFVGSVPAQNSSLLWFLTLPLHCFLRVNEFLAVTFQWVQGALLSVALWMLVFAVIFSIWYYFRGYRFQGVVPVILAEKHERLTISDSPTPVTDEDLSEALLIGTLGTRGDHIPMYYYGRLAALFGVRTHVYRIHVGDNDTLKQLRRADFTGLRSSYMQLMTTSLLPYRSVFQPFVDLGGKVDSYSLSPSSKYVKPLNFGGNPTVFSKIASFTHQFFSPTVRVGSLTEALLPRSPDGRKLLRKLPAVASRLEGYTHGSEDASVIPEGVRQRCEALERGDHQVTMRKFGSLYSHAGAGTIQTALMSGLSISRRHICDKNIDRWYHRLPKRSEVMERSPYVFLGFLILRGYKLKMPIHHKVIAVGIWCCASFGVKSVTWCASQVYRVYAVILAFKSMLHSLLLFALTFPMLTRILGWRWFRDFLTSIVFILLEAPLLTQLPWFFTLAYWVNNFIQAGPRVVREITNWFDTRTVLVMTSNEQFPAPFGHWYFECKDSGKRYEGQFVGEKGWMQKFAWVSNTALVNNTQYEDRGYYQTLYMFFTGIMFIALSSLLIGCSNPLIGGTLLLVDAFIFVFVLMEPVHELLAGRSVKKIRKEIHIPLPFTSNSMEKLTSNWEKNQKAGLYHPFYTCQSMGLEVVLSNSLILSGFCTLIFLFSLTVLIPGWFAQALVPVCKRYGVKIFGLPAEVILSEIQSRTSFAARSSPAGSVEDTALAQGQQGEEGYPVEAPQEVLPEPMVEEDPSEPELEQGFKSRLDHYRKCGIPESELPHSVKEENELIDHWTRKFEEPLEVFSQVHSLMKLSMDPGQSHSLTLAEAEHVRAMAIADYLENHKSPEEVKLEGVLQGEGAVEVVHGEMPPSENDPTSVNANLWARFLGILDDFLARWSGDKFVADIISWLRNQRAKHLADLAFRLYHLLCFVGNVVYTSSFQSWRILNMAMACFVTALFPIEEAKRLKSAWAFASLSQTPFLSTKRKFQESIAWSSKEPRGDFLESFTAMVDDINRYCKKHGAPGIELHPQYRKVNVGRPVLDDEQAGLLGLEEGAYVKDQRSTDFTASLREKGAPISSDTVYLTEKIEYVQQSVKRYVPRYEPVSGEDKWLAAEIAEVFGEMHPDTFKDAKTLTPRQVNAYIKMKYAPGSPWISIYKTRQALQDAGITDALFEMVEDYLMEGKYPDMYHKAFVKSQVVNLEKVVLGNKNVRTVVAEELLTYFMNQCMELERNHRHNWKETGTGIGMPMNQSMVHLYNQLMSSRKEYGGLYAIADAHEYDSRKSPFAFEVLAKLAEIGYQGKPQASVLRAKYDALQSSFIFQETMPNHHNSASVIMPCMEIANQLMATYPGKFITARLIHAAFPRVSQEDLYNPNHPVHSLYKNKVVLAGREEELTFTDKSGRSRYRLLSPIFVQAFLNDVPYDIKVPFQKFANVNELKVWLVESVSENIELLYNVAQKNRGGGTGENATSWDNSWGFKAAFIASWIRYMEHFQQYLSPKDFFLMGNKIYNTGDDSAIKLTINIKDFDRKLFMKCAERYGLELDFDFTGDIKDVEYLGNAVRRPNSDDKRKLAAWQKMMTNVQRSRKEEVQPPKLPRWLVYHKERDAYIRLSSRRYYQNQPGNLSFVHANVAKFSGMATIAIFNPTLWNILANAYCEDAERLARYYNVPGFAATIKRDQFGMEQIVLKDSSNARRGRALRQHVQANPGYKLTKQEQFFVFMSGSVFPSQSKSIRDALDIKTQLPVLAQQLSFIQKLERKSGNLLEATNLIVDYVSESLGNLPRYMYKMQANILPATGEPAFATANYPVEHFIAKCQEPESEGFLLGKLARSPWASVTNGQDFYRHYQDVEFRENHDKYTKEDYANRLILALGLYAGFYAAENYLVRIPLFGFLIRIFYMILIDTPKVYGIVSCLYWHYYGDNSPVISALMPKDIFIWGKRFAMFIASNLPMWLVAIPLSPFFYLYYILSFAVLPIEWLCQLIVSGKQNSEHPGSKEHAAPFDNPWDREVRTEEGRFQVALRQTTDLVLPPTHAGAEQQVVKDIPKPFVIKSAVGSGKSSLLPYALLNNARWLEQFRDLNAPTGGRVVLSLPRTILRDKWSSPLENDRQPVQRLKQGVNIDPKSKILIGTDGHLLNRVLAGELTDKDIFLLDEFHELNGQKVALLEELTQRKCTVMLPSATPKPVPGLEVGVMEAGIPRRFAPDIWPISDSISPADALRQFGGNFVTQWPVTGPPNADAFKERILIKCTHINGRNGVNETLEILQYDQWNCYALTSETARDPIPDSAQVVIATDVINTGISLPGFKLLVYDGKMHAVDQGEHSVTWVDPDTKHQGMARVGRYGPGDAVLCPVSAGTGPTPQVYPAMSYLHWSMNAQAHDLPQLCDFQGYATPELRRHYASTKLTPYLAVSTNLPANVRDAVSMYHAIANSGCRANEIRMVYTKLVSGKKVSESYELIEKFAADKSRVPVPYEAAVMAMAQEPVLYMCRNLTEKTLVPVATTLSTKLEPHAPALYDAYCAKTTGPLIPYRGRLRPLEEAESKVKNAFIVNKDTKPMELYDQIINIYESEAKEARDALSDAIKTVADIKIKPSKNDPVMQVKNAIRKILATKFNALAKEQKLSEPKASRLKVNLTEDSKLSPTLTYTTVDNVQYIHHHKKECPLCDETGRHEHIGYNGAKNDAFDMRDEWFDALIEHENFIFFHHGESVTNSQPEDQPKKIGDRKGKGRALSGASSTLNPSARAFIPPRLDLG